MNSIPLNGSGDVVRVGRYGPYLQRGEASARSVPEDLAPDELTPEKVEELLSAPSGDRELGTTADGREITAKSGRYGPYVTDGEKSSSLFESMSLDTITLADAEKLLTLPRTLGELDGDEVTAQNGRYGPYIKSGTDSRSLESEEQLFTVDLEQAQAIFAQPKQRRGRRHAEAAAQGTRQRPASGKPMVVKDGRFGPYVTDGETNASLRARRLGRGTHRRARVRAARRPALARAGQEVAAKRTAKKAPAKRTAKKAGQRRRKPARRRQPVRRRRRRLPRKLRPRKPPDVPLVT